MSNRWKLALAIPLFFVLRLSFGLWAPPVQPMMDELQTYLIGLKFYSTGAWPYYGNDVITPPDNLVLQTQDPGALESLMIGGPLYLWPSPLAPFVALNLFTLGGFCFFAFYCCKRLPRLSPWFVVPWVLTAPWCLHYTTGMINLSYSIALMCFLLPALLESLPSMGIGWMPLPLANALMGFCFSGWTQFHRNFVLMAPFIAASFFLQWRESRKFSAPLYFLLGALPLEALVVPTFFQPDYRLFRDVAGFSPGLNLHNLKQGFVILVQFFALASFEMPRFIGMSTADRAHYLAQNVFRLPGFFLWYFGFFQVLALIGYLFDFKSARPGWKSIRSFTWLVFLMVFGSLLFTVKNPDVNTFCEMLPVAMLFSLYVWDRWWDHPWGRKLLWFFLACVLVFQSAFIASQLPLRKSFYLEYHDAMARAVQEKNYHLLGERRPGSFY